MSTEKKPRSSTWSKMKKRASNALGRSKSENDREEKKKGKFSSLREQAKGYIGKAKKLKRDQKKNFERMKNKGMQEGKSLAGKARKIVRKLPKIK